MKSRALCVTIVAMVSSVLIQSQTVYDIPFASSKNTIELTVANASGVSASNVSVVPDNIPSWLKISPEKQVIKKIDKHSEELALFTFSVDKTAPVKSKQELTFSITTADGQKWTKKFTISVRPPETFELLQNYPNPFNPTTRMDFTLPQDAYIVLKVINTLGQEVATVVDGFQTAGYKSVEFDASTLSSGLYFYRLQAGKFTATKKMMLVK